MSQIEDRLARIRAREGLSLRGFVNALEERTGLDVAHDSARRYETGETRIPASYVADVCRAFGVSPAWLLTGAGSPSRHSPSVIERAFDEITEIVGRVQGLEGDRPSGSMIDLVREEWERFTRGLPAQHRLRTVIVESWNRSRDAGVDHGAADLEVPSVSDQELRERQDAHRGLIEAARPHLEWLSTAIHDLSHVVYLVCRDGIVLTSVTNDDELLDEWALHPGRDWSEGTMGTNGAGTALASRNVVAVLGPEHFMRSSHGCTCLGAPIRNGSGDVVGAIDVSMSFAGWHPHRLLFVGYAADMIERTITEREREA